MVVGKLNVVSQVAECRKLVADRLTDVRNRHVVAKGVAGGGEEKDWEFGISRGKLYIG